MKATVWEHLRHPKTIRHCFPPTVGVRVDRNWIVAWEIPTVTALENCLPGVNRIPTFDEFGFAAKVAVVHLCLTYSGTGCFKSHVGGECALDGQRKKWNARRQTMNCIAWRFFDALIKEGSNSPMIVAMTFMGAWKLALEYTVMSYIFVVHTMCNCIDREFRSPAKAHWCGAGRAGSACSGLTVSWQMWVEEVRPGDGWMSWDRSTTFFLQGQVPCRSQRASALVLNDLYYLYRVTIQSSAFAAKHRSPIHSVDLDVVNDVLTLRIRVVKCFAACPPPVTTMAVPNVWKECVRKTLAPAFGWGNPAHEVLVEGWITTIGSSEVTNLGPKRSSSDKTGRAIYHHDHVLRTT